MISELKETCKDLDKVIRVSSARKLRIERLIRELQRGDHDAGEGGDLEGEKSGA